MLTIEVIQWFLLIAFFIVLVAHRRQFGALVRVNDERIRIMRLDAMASVTWVLFEAGTDESGLMSTRGKFHVEDMTALMIYLSEHSVDRAGIDAIRAEFPVF